MDDLHPLAQVTNIVIAKGGMTEIEWMTSIPLLR